jgi:hypothetical protein
VWCTAHHRPTSTASRISPAWSVHGAPRGSGHQGPSVWCTAHQRGMGTVSGISLGRLDAPCTAGVPRGKHRCGARFTISGRAGRPTSPQPRRCTVHRAPPPSWGGVTVRSHQCTVHREGVATRGHRCGAPLTNGGWARCPASPSVASVHRAPRGHRGTIGAVHRAPPPSWGTMASQFDRCTVHRGGATREASVWCTVHRQRTGRGLHFSPAPVGAPCTARGRRRTISTVLLTISELVGRHLPARPVHRSPSDWIALGVVQSVHGVIPRDPRAVVSSRMMRRRCRWRRAGPGADQRRPVHLLAPMGHMVAPRGAVGAAVWCEEVHAGERRCIGD